MLPEPPFEIDGRYFVLAELGHGAHAIVYRALDREQNRDVAVKVLRPELVDSDVNARFRREIRLTSQLSSPHILHVFGSGEWMGTSYFATDLIEGATLAERLQREKQLPVDDALAIVKDVAAALDHAHRNGVVHRDVKPANILLTDDGALLSDFGVARAMERQEGTLATSTGVAVGTLLYMSPEQLCAEKDIDARSDQYALALVLYELLAGVPPHVAANAEGLRALRIASASVPVRIARSASPPGVDRAIQRALSPSPADRFRSVAEFVAAFDAPVDSPLEAQAVQGRTLAAARRSTLRVQRLAAAAVICLAGAAAVAILRSGGVSAASETANIPLAFTIVAAGDTMLTANFARALIAELHAWPGVDAILDADNGSAPRRARIEATASELGDALNVVLSFRVGAKRMRDIRVNLPVATRLDGDSLHAVASRLIMAFTVPLDSADDPGSIRGRPTEAVRAYSAAWVALLRGNLADAETGFASVSRTTTMPRALLWRAIVASWRQPSNVSAWRESAVVAAAADHGSLRDSLLASGLMLRATDGDADACARFSSAAAIDGGDFASWFGLGECLQYDSLVVSDPARVVQKRFRSSYWQATRAYEQAIDRLISPELVPLFERLSRVTFARNPATRRGRLRKGIDTAFVGMPRLVDDSITVLPIEERRFLSGANESVPDTYQRAVRRGRVRLLQLALSLVDRAPASFDARSGHARALEYAGVLSTSDSTKSALGVLATARRLARTMHDTVTNGLAEVRVKLRLADFTGAHQAGQRLLTTSRLASPAEAERLAPVALLIGDGARAESLLVRAALVSAQNADGVPPSVALPYAAYSVAAANGDCAISVRKRDLVVNAVTAHFSPQELSGALATWLAPGDWMWLTCPESATPQGASRDDPLLRAMAALRTNRRAQAAALVRFMSSGRSGAAASSVPWDTRFSETWLLAQVGDTLAARAQLSAAFSELADTMDYVLFDVAQVSGLRRSLELCEAFGDIGGTRPSKHWCATAHASLNGK